MAEQGLAKPWRVPGECSSLWGWRVQGTGAPHIPQAGSSLFWNLCPHPPLRPADLRVSPSRGRTHLHLPCLGRAPVEPNSFPDTVQSCD